MEEPEQFIFRRLLRTKGAELQREGSAEFLQDQRGKEGWGVGGGKFGEKGPAAEQLTN